MILRAGEIASLRCSARSAWALPNRIIAPCQEVRMNRARIGVVIIIIILVLLTAAFLVSRERHPTDYFPIPENATRGA